MCPVSAPVQISSFWHYVPLEHNYIEDSYERWPPNPKTEVCGGPPKKKFKRVWGISAPVIFFSFWHYTPLDRSDWPLMSISTSQPKHETRSGPSKKISQNFTSHQFTRKPLIAEILERWLLVGKKVPYKFPNDIASKLSTLHGVNRRFVCRPKNGKFVRMAIARRLDV